MNTNTVSNNASISNNSNFSSIITQKPQTNTQQFIELYGKNLTE